MHAVWILDCRSCNAFLTNRAMKAVLLLRPNVPLFSTDALPANCSPYSPASRHPPYSASKAHPPPRTCDCLTQTLCCHGCGTPVGYMIVAPCTRCTSSVHPTARATNGHRFVFHSSEIVAEHRLYVPGEPGVLTDHVPSFNFTPPFRPLSFPHPLPSRAIHPIDPSSFPSDSQVPYPSDLLSSARDSSLDADIDGLVRSSHALYTQARETVERARHLLFNERLRQLHLPPQPHRSHILRPGPVEPCPESADSQSAGDLPPQPPLKPGDILCWQHLSRIGELPDVKDDDRARSSRHAAFKDAPTTPAHLWCAR